MKLQQFSAPFRPNTLAHNKITNNKNLHTRNIFYRQSIYSRFIYTSITTHMKHSFLLLLITICGNSVFAQPSVVYAEPFDFVGKPQKAKVYYLAAGERPQQSYHIIENDYEQQLRQVTSYRLVSHAHDYDTMYDFQQSLAPKDMATQYLSGYLYIHHRILHVHKIEEMPDGSYRRKRGKDHFYFRLDEQQRLTENTYIFDGNLIATSTYTYSEDGKTLTGTTVNDKGEVTSNITITYNQHGHPVKYIGYDHEENESYTCETSYTYDSKGNFTKSIETYNGKHNRTVIREITY